MRKRLEFDKTKGHLYNGVEAQANRNGFRSLERSRLRLALLIRQSRLTWPPTSVLTDESAGHVPL